MADSSNSPSTSLSDESSEAEAQCCSSSSTAPSLLDAVDFSRTASDVSTFSERSVDLSGPFGTAAVSKLIGGRGSPAAALSRLSMKPRADVLDRRSTEDELDLVKERFSKLLLGEDMSGGGKGVCTAVAISNAITNLYATVFGSCHKLEPLPPGKKTMWRREMDCLLAVCDYIVEFYPSTQPLSDGTRVEVMATRPRSDIYINLPALEKLDAMLIEIMDSFQKAEFWYADAGTRSFGSVTSSSSPSSSFRRSTTTTTHRNEDKWWVPVPCVPEGGLSAKARKELRQRRECANQIHKAAVAINSGVLSDMEVPESFMALLPRSGKASVGDAVYRAMHSSDKFSPDYLLDCVDVSSEHEALALADRVEAAMYVWRRKATASHGAGRSAQWSRVKELAAAADDGGEGGKNVALAGRAESLLLCIKHRFPGLSQTTLDTSKIQFNKDVGQAILESYSRVLESLAFNIVSWTDEVLFADKAARK